MSNYQVLPVSSIKSFQMRDKRQDVINRLTERIKAGYNPARPMSVIVDNGGYLAADGNHRLEVVTSLGMTEVPCLIYPEGTNPYSLAVSCNQDEDTYAPMDLFDWLDIIRRLREEGLMQAVIGERIGWSRKRIADYSRTIDNVPKILDIVRIYQTGRGTENVPNGTFNFTEGWFRDSGLYDLCEKYQLKLINAFITDKFNWNKSKVQSESAKYKQWQEFIKIAEDELVNAEDLPTITEQIENNTFKTEAQLRQKIKDFNSKAANKLICGDSVVELEKLNDSSIDLVITDPPYGIDYTSNHSIYDNYITKNGIENDGLQEALELLDKTCEILNRKTKPDAHIYIFTSWKMYPEFKTIIENYFNLKNLIIWDKGNASMGDLENSWGNKYEMIIFATKGRRKLNTRKQDIISIPRISTVNAIHPTQKPVELIKELLSVSSQKADTVCDPFMGSGSTIKATKEYGDLSYIGIELDREIFEKAKAFIGGDTA